MNEVNHPPHYNQGRIEVIEFIEDQKLDYHLGNAIKYICRCQHKDNMVQDLEKAIWYIRRRIETLKPNPVRPNDMGAGSIKLKGKLNGEFIDSVAGIYNQQLGGQNEPRKP